jgi:hypothetical protein
MRGGRAALCAHSEGNRARGLWKRRRKGKALKTKSGSKNLIGTLGEKKLHSALKAWYSRPGDRVEAEVDGFHIDIVRRRLLIEIQTGNFSSQKRKLNTLIEEHPVRLVFPIAQEKWIVRLASDGTTLLGKRKSPRRGNIYDLFAELVSLPDLIEERNFSLEVLLIREEEVHRDDGRGSWRRKGWSIFDRCLIEVVDAYLFKNSADFLKLVPQNLPERFTTRDLAEAIAQPHWLAQKMAYCLRHMRLIQGVGKKGNALLYAVTDKSAAKEWFVSPASGRRG